MMPARGAPRRALEPSMERRLAPRRGRIAAPFGLAAAAVLVALPLAAGAPRREPAAEPARAAPLLRFEEVAPGVVFAFAATDPFEGANAGFVVQDDGVIVLEASLPRVAREVRAEVARRTSLPIRVVFDTHDHWDHSFGNGVFAEAGAAVVAHAKCAERLATRGAATFAEQAASPDEAVRARVAGTAFAGATLAFEEPLVVGRGENRIELLHLGRGHTRGDAVAWLPGPRVLFTGDLCVNGPHNYCGDGDVASWIEVLARLEGLAPRIVCPGHGARGGPELLAQQRRWFLDLTAAVAAGIEAGLDAEAIGKGLDLPWYQEWTGVPASSRRENVAQVFAEATGRAPPLALTEELGLTPGPSPTRESPGWSAPRKVVAVGFDPAEAAWLQRAAPGVVVAAAENLRAARELAADADGVIGGVDAALLDAAPKLRWAQVGSAGVERYVGLPRIADRSVVLTNAQRLYGPEIADHALAMALALLRGLPAAIGNARERRAWDLGESEEQLAELRGRTVLVAGLGGIGREVARRAAAAGARVVATNPPGRARPRDVERVAPPEALRELAAQADLVFVCVPLTPATERMCDERFFAALKPGARLINVARGKVVDTAALLAALKSGRLAGAGLDVTDPEPLPPDHELWTLPQVIVTPHVAASSAEAGERQRLLFRENLRRFAAGEALLSVVDPAAGY